MIQPASGLARQQQAHILNAALNQRIRYRFDTHPSGDYWSSARETLNRLSGDCEDYAIAKMQALQALHILSRDLFMTIGNDGNGRMIHAVLLMRTDRGFWVFDNRVDRLIPANENEYAGFYPIISFSADGASWLHGYPRGQVPAAVKALSLALSQGKRLPIGNSESSRRRLRG